MHFEIKENTILRTLHGSRAYGTNVETSDYDYKGVAVAPLDTYVGFARNFEQHETYVSKGHDRDEVIYDIRKFFKLASDCNPNILEILFVDESDIISITPIGEKLMEMRDDFISKKAKYTFTGYAISQLKRIKGHRGWLLDPPKKKPEREDYGLPIDTKMSTSERGAYEHVSKTEVLPDHIMRLLTKEKQYAAAKRRWDQYQSWKKNRNKARAKDEAEFGFDGKHAYHLVRLLRMGKEILQGKGVLVKRPDAEELLEIRSGLWSYDRLISESEEYIKDIDELYEKSSLPKTPQVNKLHQKCAELVLEFHNT